MARQMMRAFFLGLIALCLAWVVPGNIVMAREAQEHGGARASSDAERMAEAEGVPSEGKINPLEIKPALSLWTLIVFLVLAAVLGKYAWGPLLEALHAREKHLEHVLLESERARNESESNLAEHRKLMARAGDDVRAILDKARQEAQASAEALIKQAQAEAETAKQRAQRDIGQAKDQALAEIWEKTADMAVSVAGKVLSKELSDTDHRRLLDSAIKELPATNGHGGNRA